MPTAQAQAPSELEIIAEYLAPYDTAAVQGDHCKRFGGASGEVTPGTPMVSFPATNLYLQHHEVWHEHFERGRAIDDAYRSEADPYGTIFVEFHRHMLHEFEAWRMERGYPAVTIWDPGTPIPATHLYASNVPPGFVTTDDPMGQAVAALNCLPHDTNDPKLPLPSWFTLAGGKAGDPVFGFMSLCEFPTLNAVAKALDAPEGHTYHGLIHRTVAGDLAPAFTSARDPIFWPWHKYLDLEVFGIYESECSDSPVPEAQTTQATPAAPAAILMIGILAGAVAKRRTKGGF